MLKCVQCGAETDLRRADVPYCLDCVDRAHDHIAIDRILRQALSEATHQAEAAKRDFIEVTTDVPSDIPQPDGTQNIENVSAKLKDARSELMTSHNRLSEFIERGTIPKDLKRSG